MRGHSVGTAVTLKFFIELTTDSKICVSLKTAIVITETVVVQERAAAKAFRTTPLLAYAHAIVHYLSIIRKQLPTLHSEPRFTLAGDGVNTSAPTNLIGCLRHALACIQVCVMKCISVSMDS